MPWLSPKGGCRATELTGHRRPHPRGAGGSALRSRRSFRGVRGRRRHRRRDGERPGVPHRDARGVGRGRPRRGDGRRWDRHAGGLGDARAVQLLGGARPRAQLLPRTQPGHRDDGGGRARPTRGPGHRAAPGRRRGHRRARRGARPRPARRRDRLERPRRDHRRDQLPAVLPGGGRRRVSASSSTRSTRPTGTASPIHRWRRR